MLGQFCKILTNEKGRVQALICVVSKSGQLFQREREREGAPTRESKRKSIFLSLCVGVKMSGLQLDLVMKFSCNRWQLSNLGNLTYPL